MVLKLILILMPIVLLLSFICVSYLILDSIFLILKYNSDLVNGNALGLIDLYRLKNNVVDFILSSLAHNVF